MSRVVSWVFVVLLAACGVAHGADGKKHSGKLSQWSAVEALPQDTLIEVSREGWAGVEECRVESADDSAVTCVAERPEGDARLVFPRDTLRNVWVIEPARNLHIGRWIMVGMGVAIVAAAGVGVACSVWRLLGRLWLESRFLILKILSGTGLHRCHVCGGGWFMQRRELGGSPEDFSKVQLSWLHACSVLGFGKCDEGDGLRCET